MRLLKIRPDGGFDLISVYGKRIPVYAILSHTWESDDQEVTFRDFVDGLGASKAGYRKIRFCGEQAKLDGIQHFWVDSCCIDKSSSAELAEAINSMFRWYRNAVKCYAYLSDITIDDVRSRALAQSRWFTRGWTLQELLAPATVDFFSREGHRLGDKQSLQSEILQATGIPVQVLQQPDSMSKFSYEERMSWSAKRETTIEEDEAYCLLGIFSVHLPLIYGEGKENAFRRLQREISMAHTREGPPRLTNQSDAEKSDACLSNLFPTNQTQLISQVPEGDLIDVLAGYSTLEMTNNDTDHDMRALIHSRVEDFAGRRHLKPDITSRITQFLESNANGMFLWVILVIRELERRDERLTDEVVMSKLSKTPLTIIATYEAIVKNVPPTRKLDMWRIVRWLLFGHRSLTLAELEIALCLDTSISSWHDFPGDLNFLCGSFIQIDGPQSEVTLTHQTTRDFFEKFSQSSKTTRADGIDMTSHAANEHLATICIEYLLREDIYSDLDRHGWYTIGYSTHYQEMQGVLSRHPFLRYVIESWYFHLEMISTPSPSLSTMLRRLLSSQTRRDDIMSLNHFIKRRAVSPYGHTAIHMAAYFNLSSLLKTYISEDNSLVHATTAARDTPLVWASEMGNTECVEILLEAGANPNAFERDGWSALHWAARNGHVNVVPILLKYGASLSQTDGMNHTPLEWAINRENWQVADLLRQWHKQGTTGKLNIISMPKNSMTRDAGRLSTQEYPPTWELPLELPRRSDIRQETWTTPAVRARRDGSGPAPMSPDYRAR